MTGAWPGSQSLQNTIGFGSPWDWGPPPWVENSEGGRWGFHILKITMWVHCSLPMRPPWGQGWWRTVSERDDRQAGGLDHCRAVGVSEHLAVCSCALRLCTHTRAHTRVHRRVHEGVWLFVEPSGCVSEYLCSCVHEGVCDYRCECVCAGCVCVRMRTDTAICMCACVLGLVG